MHLFLLITLARKTNTTRTNTVPKIAIRTGALNRGESEGSERAVKRSNIDKKNNSNNKNHEDNDCDNNNGINDTDDNNKIIIITIIKKI